MREPLANIGTRVWVQTKGSARISPPERKQSEGRRQSGCNSLAEAQLAHRKRQRKAEALHRIFPPPQGSSPSAHDRSLVCFLGNKLKGTGKQFLQGCSLPEGSSSGGAGLLQRQTQGSAAAQGARDQGKDAPAAGGEVRAPSTMLGRVFCSALALQVQILPRLAPIPYPFVPGSYPYLQQ